MIRKTLLPFCLILLPLNAVAQTAEEKGLAIAREAQQRDNGWGDQQAVSRMILRNRHGEQSVRETRSSNLEVPNDGDKVLIIFDAPADVKGTAFLNYTHAIEPDEQWLYLPALARVKRISSSNKSGPFMGSEFAYEDISSQELEKYTYKWLRDEGIDGKDCFVVERYPQYPDSGYTRQIVWIDKTMYQPLKIEFFDRKNAPLKTLTFHGYSSYLEKYWRPSQMEVVNHQTGKSTLLEWTEYKFRTGLSDRDFDQNALKRAK